MVFSVIIDGWSYFFGLDIVEIMSEPKMYMRVFDDVVRIYINF